MIIAARDLSRGAKGRGERGTGFFGFFLSLRRTRNATRDTDQPTDPLNVTRPVRGGAWPDRQNRQTDRPTDRPKKQNAAGGASKHGSAQLQRSAVKRRALAGLAQVAGLVRVSPQFGSLHCVASSRCRCRCRTGQVASSRVASSGSRIAGREVPTTSTTYSICNMAWRLIYAGFAAVESVSSRYIPYHTIRI